MKNMYEKMIQELEATGSYRVTKRLETVEYYNKDDGSKKNIGIYLDVETTGLNSDTDKVIELAMIPFEYNEDGKIFKVLPAYTSYQDPGIPLQPITTEITGITDEMITGHAIDLEQVELLLSQASIVIAHNARFDRGFMENFYDGFKDIAWGCSIADINWNEEGMGSLKLEYLAYEYGFFYNAHRATTDCQAGIEILSNKLNKSGDLVLKRLLDTANATNYRIWAVKAPFEKKDTLKQRSYRWSSGNDGNPKAWYADIPEQDLDSELAYLESEIGIKSTKNLPMKKIDALTRYSKRA